MHFLLLVMYLWILNSTMALEPHAAVAHCSLSLLSLETRLHYVMAVVFTSEQETKCSISGVIFVFALVAWVLCAYFFVRCGVPSRAEL